MPHGRLVCVGYVIESDGGRPRQVTVVSENQRRVSKEVEDLLIRSLPPDQVVIGSLVFIHELDSPLPLEAKKSVIENRRGATEVNACTSTLSGALDFENVECRKGTLLHQREVPPICAQSHSTENVTLPLKQRPGNAMVSPSRSQISPPRRNFRRS
ncbi:hypothetical protein PJI16_01720 [Nitrospira sp. MA-1]|nr:hypothetical protein [Nitrospira sp. MA-1]